MAISWAGLAGAERQPSKQIGESQRVARAKSPDANLIELVKAQLEKNSAASSNLCVKTGTKDVIVSHTLHKQKAWIFADSEELQEQMSVSTMRRIVNEPKEPQCKSDYCQYCHNLDAKVIPKINWCGS